MKKIKTNRTRSAPKKIYRWTRELHLYLGLFVSPFLLIYSISAILLNHDRIPWSVSDTERFTYTITVPDEENSRDLARLIINQIEITGEMGFVSLNQNTNQLSFPLEKPGRYKMVRADLSSGNIEVEKQNTGMWDAMVYLHEMPGAHLVNIRGNWIFIRLWGWLADLTVYLILFISASGVYLWSVLNAERKAGLVFLGAGVFSFITIVVSLVR